jgi:hypothetical protein
MIMRETGEPYHIVIIRKNHALLSFMRIRIVVNGNQIYPLYHDKPVMITVDKKHPKVVITDGYHYTKPIELNFDRLQTHFFKVICVIDDIQLIVGSLLLGVLYLAGFYTGVFFLKLISFAPILYFIFYYYINRKNFIRIRPLKIRKH